MEDHGLVLGGEQSGHLIVHPHAITGDGPLVGALLLRAVRDAGKPLSELAGVVEKHPQVLRNVRVADRGGLDAASAFWAEVDVVQSELGSAGRVLVRPSGTEPVVRVMVEARDADAAEGACARLVAALVRALGEGT
jgi:phosphoglucosamine mutase